MAERLYDGGGSIKIHTQDTKLVPTPYLSICNLPGPNYPVPKMSMRPASPRTRESQPQPTSSNGAPPRASVFQTEQQWPGQSESTEILCQRWAGDANGGWQQMQRSSPVSAAKKAKTHLKRRAKLRKLAASR